MLTFQISCKYLWGYNNIIDVKQFSSIQEIIDKVLENYTRLLVEYNLLDLKDLLDEKRKDFHIHGGTYEELVKMDTEYATDQIIYICSHCGI